MLVYAPDLGKDSPAATWIIAPYIPTEGVVLLYGKKGVGKSPLTWALAESYATGASWLGHIPTHTGRVLYIEADTPRLVVAPRMRLAVTSPNIAVYFPPGSISDHDGWRRLKEETAEVRPGLVIVNTLRKVHAGDDKSSDVPAQVYDRFRGQWPNACHVFVHHEKKTPANPDHTLTEGEEFSGSLAWANDAQVVLRLWCHTGRPSAKGRETILTMTGNQLAPLAPPTRYFLAEGLVGPLCK